jgi:hypothetical protein
MGNYCVHCERCDKIIAMFHRDYPYVYDDDGRLVCLECFAQIMDERYKGEE